MDLFNKIGSDWKTFDETLSKLISLIKNLEKENNTLKEKNKILESKNNEFKKIKKEMEGKIRKLIDKIKSIKE
jgi:SMC interacting uncharacterized protein involved in chromosome segregation